MNMERNKNKRLVVSLKRSRAVEAAATSQASDKLGNRISAAKAITTEERPATLSQWLTRNGISQLEGNNLIRILEQRRLTAHLPAAHEDGKKNTHPKIVMEKQSCFCRV